ncbi:MAG TPA: nuclear transport factor 2 family protein [Candidatus Binatia bacterium]|jgi:TolB-like protein/ketosteroid isomerase-like protein|nr:nuclear transport factor 2 family protein [Candidatus Binatia bacterium]
MLYGDPAYTLLPTREDHHRPVSSQSEKTDQRQQLERSGEKRQWWSSRSYQRLKAFLSLAVIFVAILSVVALLNFFKDHTREAGQPIAVGVMDFETSNGTEFEWMQQVIRTYLNSQLSNVPGLKVYSKEHLDFLGWQKPAAQIEIANQLGITKIISGRFDVIADKVFIEAHLVDVQTGTQGKSIILQGERKDFFALQQQIAATIVASLNLTVPPQEKSAAGEVPQPPRLDTYKLLLDAEGETSPTQKKEEPHSNLPSWWQWPEAGTAWADEATRQKLTPEEEIRQVLERYRQAYEKKDLSLLESVYDTLTATQRTAIEKYFKNAQGLQVTIRNIDITVRGDEAAVSCTREDEFTDAETGQKVKLDARFTKIFINLDGSWKITAGKR